MKQVNDSLRISLKYFRSFRGPLLNKPVTGQELFCCFLQQTVFKTHITLKYFLTTIGSWKNIAAPPTSYSAFAGVTNNNPWLHLSFRNIIAPFMGPFWLLLMSNVETNMIWQHETNQSIELLAKKDFRFSLHSKVIHLK